MMPNDKSWSRAAISCQPRMRNWIRNRRRLRRELLGGMAIKFPLDDKGKWENHRHNPKTRLFAIESKIKIGVLTP